MKIIIFTNYIMPQQPSPDLTHADWWIRTTTKLAQKVDSSLRVSVLKLTNNTQHLVIENISEETLPKLSFLTNTDQNNNYGYLEIFNVYTTNDYSTTPISVPGLNDLLVSVWSNSDTDAFLNDKKTFTPFFQPLNDPVTKKPLSIKKYIDTLTATIPWAPKTTGQTQYYSIVVNPDSVEVDPSTWQITGRSNNFGPFPPSTNPSTNPPTNPQMIGGPPILGSPIIPVMNPPVPF